MLQAANNAETVQKRSQVHNAVVDLKSKVFTTSGTCTEFAKDTIIPFYQTQDYTSLLGPQRGQTTRPICLRDVEAAAA